MLEISHLGFQYNGTAILNGVCGAVEKGRVVSIVGPNGAGKTTLLKCIIRILKPAQGIVRIGDQDVGNMTRRELARRMGYVPQNTPFRFPMTVFEMVLTGRRPHMAWRPSEKDLQCTGRIIQEMHLADLSMRDMDQLSGGQAQKVLLARALAQEPEYLLLDEPTSSLDLHHQLEVLEQVAQWVQARGMGVLMAMHDLNLAARFSHHILMMQAGRIICEGTPSEVITPQNIRRVYHVEALVRRDNGYPHIQPLCCVAHHAAMDGPVAQEALEEEQRTHEVASP